MIATWMLAASALTLALGLAAFAAERALRLLGREARAVWVAALLVGAAWPLVAPFIAMPATARATTQVISSGFAGAALPVSPAAERPSWSDRASALDAPLAILWFAATLLLLARAVVGVRALRRLVRNALPHRLDGHDVLISSGGGPAAFGIVNPRILLPDWMLELDDEVRAIVLRHEREHLRTRDPALLAVAWGLVALMPWNLGLWWCARRLRVSAELDCDRRVIRGGVDARAYSRLLLFISQRQAHSPLAVAMAGSPSTLHERIIAMHPVRHSHPRLRAAGLCILALVAATGASSPVIGTPLARVRPRVLGAFQQPAVQRPAQQPPRTPSPARVDSSARRAAPPSGAKWVPASPAAKVPPADSAKWVPLEPAKSGTNPRPPVVVDSAVRAVPLVREGPAPVLLVHVDSGPGKQSYYDFAVQAPADFAPGGSPTLRYPDILRSAERGGVLVLQMVVDTMGLMMPGSMKVVRKSHDLFEASFRAEMDQLRFRPARVGGQKVKQLVQLVYRFDVEGSTELPEEVTLAPNLHVLEVRVRAPRP